MEHRDYYETIAQLIPVLAIASMLELRALVPKEVQGRDLFARRVSVVFYGGLAVMTVLMMLSLVVMLGDLKADVNPSPLVQALLEQGLVLTVALIVFTPFTALLGNLFYLWQPTLGDKVAEEIKQRQGRDTDQEEL